MHNEIPTTFLNLNLTPIGIIDNNDISSDELEKKDGRVNRKIGDIVGVSRTTIWQWKQVKDNSSEHRLKALSEGKIEPYDLFKKMKAAKMREKLIQQFIGINSKFLMELQFIVVIFGILQYLPKYQMVQFL
ncbi:MAG: hypothetical protein WCA39_11895 [Nitrososphaeraceae archaeon]